MGQVAAAPARPEQSTVPSPPAVIAPRRASSPGCSAPNCGAAPPTPPKCAAAWPAGTRCRMTRPGCSSSTTRTARSAAELPQPRRRRRPARAGRHRAAPARRPGAGAGRRVGVRITVDGDEVRVEDLRAPDPIVAHGTVDAAAAPVAEGLRPELAPLRLSAESLRRRHRLAAVDFMGLLGIADPAELDLATLWRAARRTRVPAGADRDRRPPAQPVLLDLKESAQLGMGPHGLCVGATGSGKCELLRTLVLALVGHATRRSDLAMVLVDYKGGATFAPFADVPHVAGIITNLATDAAWSSGVHASLDGEVQRRQQVLKDAGNIADITDYPRCAPSDRPRTCRRCRTCSSSSTSSASCSPPSRTSSTCSCRSAGSAARSACTCCCPASGSSGASCAAWRPTSSYRLGLRTLLRGRSPGPCWTPRTRSTCRRCPASATSRSTSDLQRFKAAYVSGPLADEASGGAGADAGRWSADARARQRAPDTPRRTPRRHRGRPGGTTGPTVLSTVVDQLPTPRGRVPAIWLPPLPAALTLDRPRRGVAAPRGTAGWRRRRRLPGTARAARRPGPPVAGHLAAGPRRPRAATCSSSAGPQSGKTTALRTLALGLAPTHTPARGRPSTASTWSAAGCTRWRGLPHVGGSPAATTGSASGAPSTRCARCSTREELLPRAPVDTVDELRPAARRASAGRSSAAPTSCCCIDGYGALRDEFESLDDRGARPPHPGRRATASTSSARAALERRPHRAAGRVRQPHRAAAQRTRRVQHRPQAGSRSPRPTSRAGS